MKVKLVWATPEGDKLVAYMARVSNPANQGNEETASKLISYLIRNRHWSPFEMVNACFEIITTRDIGRQILRHRSFSFQEFSQRYSKVNFGEQTIREMRRKGSSNRQGSTNERLHDQEIRVAGFLSSAAGQYAELIDAGVAPECARAVLPEGLTPTRMYMNGTLRSWIHYVSERTQFNVQKEHREIAEAIEASLSAVFPNIFAATKF